MIKTPLFCALDVDDKKVALRIAHEIAPFVGGFKIGPRLLLSSGESLITELSQLGHVFVDCKFFDIPNTMAAALKTVHRAGASFATIHALSGGPAMKDMARVEQELSKVRPFKILAVTILTSMEQAALPLTLRSQSVAENVRGLATLAIESGLTGIVCSAEEVADLRNRFPNAYLVTPGIRFSDGNIDDQKRIADPRSALQAGASALVVGRPIVDDKDPRAQAQKFFAAIGT